MKSRKEQKFELANAIKNGKSNKKFEVFNIEAGVGKTLTSEKAMALAYINNDRRSLFVRRRIKDCENSVKNINQHARNLGITCDIAITLNSKNKKIIEKNVNFEEIAILVITQEKYKQLGLNKNKQKSYSAGRINLIIDEEVDMLELNSYSVEVYRKCLSYFPEEENILRKLYIDLTKELIEKINSDGKNRISKFPSKILENKKRIYLKMKQYINSKDFKKYIFDSNPLVIDELKSLHKSINNISNLDIKKKISNIIKKNKMTQKKLIKHLDEIMMLYTNISVIINYYGKCQIHTYNTNYHWWQLENNILLDANGGFNYIYQISNLFNIKNFPFTVDHKLWKIYYYDVSTSKSTKKNYKNFYKKIGKLIKSESDLSNQSLVLSNKAEKLNDAYEIDDLEHIKQDYHFNVAGSNAYREATSIFMTHTPYMPSVVYILKYLFYTNKPIDLNLDISYNKKSEFNHSELEKIKHTTMLGEIYQGIKRINRDNKKSASVHLVMKNPKIVKSLSELLKGSRVFKKNIRIKKYEDKQKIYDLKKYKNSSAHRCVQCIKDFAQRAEKTVSKKLIRENIGCTSQKLTKILKHKKVQKALEFHDIKVEYHKLSKIRAIG